jgi:hypothetical protein
MTKYTAIFAHSDSDVPGKLTLDASNDVEAKAELKAFVESGYRNGTWANIELSDGAGFGYRNEHGKAK